MVTKLILREGSSFGCLILAKIHMVTKRCDETIMRDASSYSSKNPYGNKTKFFANSLCQWSYSSKNPYGNKTYNDILLKRLVSYSSKNPYGNKTVLDSINASNESYSSKNPYGNKTPFAIFNS